VLHFSSEKILTERENVISEVLCEYESADNPGEHIISNQGS